MLPKFLMPAKFEAARLHSEGLYDVSLVFRKERINGAQKSVTRCSMIEGSEFELMAC